MLDHGRTPAPEPVIVCQVREAHCPGCIETVTLTAVRAVDAHAHAHRCAVLVHFLDGHGEILVAHGPILFLCARHFLLVLLHGGPAQKTGEVTEPRIGDQIGNAPEDRDREHGEPPAGQRVVPFLDTVVLVPRGLGVHRETLAVREQQPRHQNQCGQGQQNDPAAPETVEVAIHRPHLP